MQKQLLITFDYELFLGNRSGYVDSCMIEPTNRLREILEPHGIKSVFFVDTTYLLRLKEAAGIHPACAADFEKIAQQLRELVQHGHFVYPHIHPHWLDATYHADTNQWQLNSTAKYLFRNISQDERSWAFDGSVNLLNEILLSSFPGYKVNAFRAGGWSIQPFTDFKSFFEKHQFKYEFSVLGGFYQFTDAQYFDFSEAPSKTIYRFNDNESREDKNGPFIQYNISSILVPPSVTFMNKVWTKIYTRITKDHTFHKGEGQPSRILDYIAPASPKGKNLLDSNWERISVELLTAVKLGRYLKYIEKNKYMHFISHPKMVTRHNLSMFKKFIDTVIKKYQVTSDFHEMKPE